MSLSAALDATHARARSVRALQVFTGCVRVLLFLAFLPSGLTKLLGNRFTLLSPETPIGGFFETLYQTGCWWRFIGGSQLLAGVLLLIPRTATLGALLYYPIVVNICVITLSLHFRGTWVITCLMLLAATYLLCWDYDRLKVLLPWGAPPARAESA